MPFNEPFEPIYRETEVTVRARLLRSLPQDMSSTVGSFPGDMLEIAVQEFTRLWDEMNRYVAVTFPSYAYGQLLDAHGAAYGIERGRGTKASGTVRLTGTVGTVIAGNGSEIVSVPTFNPERVRATFTIMANTAPSATGATTYTIPASGVVDVRVEANDIGEEYNVPAASITMLDTPITGITGVTNLAPTTGGTSPEDDATFRARVLAEAALPVGSGTKRDYVVWATERPGVSEASVLPLWDTSAVNPGTGVANGTVLVAVRGPGHLPVPWFVVEDVQRHIDPARQLIALTEGNNGPPVTGEAWVRTAGTGTVDWDETNRQIGRTSLRYTSPAAESAVLSLVQKQDLFRFGDSDESHIWLKASDWASVADTSYLQFTVDAANYLRLPFSTVSLNGTAKPTAVGNNGWWLFRVTKSQAVKTGTLSAAEMWSQITSVALGLTTTAAVTVNADYWHFKTIGGAQYGQPNSRDVLGEGRAPIGASVTVVTPTAFAVNITFSVQLDVGYTLTGSPGTANYTELARARLIAFLAELPPGEPVRLVDIANAIHDTPGTRDFTLTAPTANYALTLLEYPTLGTLTVTLA